MLFHTTVDIFPNFCLCWEKTKLSDNQISQVRKILLKMNRFK